MQLSLKVNKKPYGRCPICHEVSSVDEWNDVTNKSCMDMDLIHLLTEEIMQQECRLFFVCPKCGAYVNNRWIVCEKKSTCLYNIFMV